MRKQINLKRVVLAMSMLLTLMSSNLLLAQTPGAGIFFQAVARDGFSNPAKDRKIIVETSLIQTTATGTVVLRESFQTGTDASGVFSISIGEGNRLSGTSTNLQGVDWAHGPFFINIKVAVAPFIVPTSWDYTKDLVDLGTSPFGSVPYALYAGSVAGMDGKLNVTDTSRILAAYAKTQTLTTLSATKLNIADSITKYVTPTQLAAKTFDITPVNNAIATKLNIADSITKYVTPAQLAATALDITPVNNAIANKLNVADSITKYVTPTQLASKTFDSTAIYNQLALRANITDVTTALTAKANASNVTTSLALKENVANKTIDVVADGTSDTKYPSAKAVKTYVDSQVTAATIADANATTKGKIQLAGDLTGTASAPIIANNAITTAKIADENITTAKINDAAITTAKIADASVTDAKITSVSGSKVNGNIAGNAATATKIATPVTINGVSFDGSANITIASAAANALTFDASGAGANTGSTFDGSAAKTISYNTIGASPLAGSSSLTTVGTITSGVWSGTAIANNKLANSALTIGSTNIALGGTSTTLSGLTSVASTNFTGNLTGDVTGNVTGNITGNVTGDLTGNVTGDLTGNVTGNVTGSLTGNATTATKLAATKNINGVAFDGSADITIAANSNTLTGTTLANNVVNSSLTSVGTITSGVWSGTTIDIAHGGTGSTTQNFVDLSTVQTIAGSKTFSNTAIFNKDVTINGITAGLGNGQLSSNTAFGNASLGSNTTGYSNAAFGGASLGLNTTGIYNTAIGKDALHNNTTGTENTGIGLSALYSNIGGGYNTALGSSALVGNTTASYNVAFGRQALGNTTTGGNNVAVGAGALTTNTTGTNNTAIGFGADIASNNLYNATAIGNGAIAAASNSIQLGNSSITSVVTSGTISATGFTGPLTGNVTGNITGNVTGNASTATKLAATKNINGVAFDGSADITIAANSNTLTGTTLASNVLNSSLTSVGTITSGTWSGTTIAIANGGTGATTAATALSNLGAAPLASPSFTGTPTAPTPATNDNSTALATTEYVKASITAANAGVSTVGAIAGTSNVNGATISGSTQLILTPADANFGGIVTTATQTFAGSKTFTNTVTFGKDIKVNGMNVGTFANLTLNTLQNTAFGVGVLGKYAPTSYTHDMNTGIGYNALFNLTTGYKNTATGSGALFHLSSGSYNSGYGEEVLVGLTTGSYNTAIGNSAGGSITNASDNTMIGNFAGNNVTGSKNIFIGSNNSTINTDGTGITTGSNNTIIGSGIRGLATTLSNNIVLADGQGNIRAQHDGTNGWTLGTITSGTWSGTVIDVAHGGTGSSTVTGAKTNLGLNNVENTAISTWTGSPYITSVGSLVAAGKSFTFQDLVLGSGTVQGKISTDGAKPIQFYPDYRYETTRFWPSGNVTIQQAGTYTDDGYMLDVKGSTRAATVNITGTGTSTSTTTGALVVAGGVGIAGNVNIGGSINAGTITATAFNGPLTGNASTSTALANGRTISTTGDLTYTSGSFDGTTNVTGTATLTNTAVTAGSYGSSTAIPTFTVDSKGRLTAAGTVGITAGVSNLNYTSTTSYAAGGTMSGTSLTLTAADATNPGLVSTSAQTFAGAKTFNSDINVNGIKIGLGGGSVSTNFVFGNGNTLRDNITGSDNMVFGQSVGMNNTGDRNLAIGSESFRYNTNGSHNVAVGYYSLRLNSSGSYNIAIGENASQSNESGNYITTIGYGADVVSNNLTNATAIGNGAIVNANNTIQLGNSSVTSVVTSGTVSATRFTGPLTGNVTGNASTATKLAATKNINGVAFDGSADITVAANSNTLTGTTLASNVVSSSLTSVGTITQGTWSSTVIGSNFGGAGSVNGLMKANGAGVVSAAVAGTDYLNPNGTNIKIGYVAGGATQGSHSIAIGSNAAQSGTQAEAAVAIGYAAGQNGQGANSVAIGAFAGNSQGANSIALNASGNALSPSNAGFYVDPVNNASTSSFMFYNTTTKEISYSAIPTLNQNTTGNATTATTAGNITATTNTTLTSLGNLATVGTITSGTWNGSVLTPAYGGTGLTSLGTGIASFLATPTSANLNTAVTDETGSGSLVFATSPTLVTPNIGTASGTSLSLTGAITSGTWSASTIGVAFGGTGLTSPGASGNLLTSNGTSWVSSAPTGVNTLTYTSGTSYANGGTISGTTLTLSAADATNPGLVSTGAQTFVGAKTFNSVLTVSPIATTAANGSATTISAQSNTNTITTIYNGGALNLNAGNGGSTGTGGNIVLTPGTGGTYGTVKVVGSDLYVYDNNFRIGYGKSNEISNTGVGYQVLNSIASTSANANSAFGFTSLTATTTGQKNTAIGANTLQFNIDGSYNTGIGYQALNKNTSGAYNSSLGTAALKSNTTGSNNVAIGYQALNSSVTNSNNVAIGYNALIYGYGDDNTAIGNSAGLNLGYGPVTGGIKNIFLGSQAGSYYGGSSGLNTTGNNSVMIGYDVRPKANGDNNEIVISGYNGTAGTVGNGSNTVTIGNSANTANYLTGVTNVNTGTLTATTGFNLSGSVNDFLEYNVQNSNTGTSAQSGYNAMANNGTDAVNFAWMGINNSTFNNPQTYNIGGANDVSFLGGGNDMYVANSNNYKSIIFSTGTGSTPFFNEKMRLTNSGTLAIGTTGATAVDTVNAKLHVAGKVKIVDGNQAAGKVLTSDANGVATWKNNGGTVTTASASTTYSTTDSYTYIIFTGSTASQTITLPTAAQAGNGREYTIKNVSSVTLTVSAGGTCKIISDSSTTNDTSAALGFEPSNNWMKLISDGTSWYVFRALF